MITDEMVEAAWKVYAAAPVENGWKSAMRAALEAAEKAAWKPIEEARNTVGNFQVWDAHHGVRIGTVHDRSDHDDWLSYRDSHNGSSKGGIRATHFRPLPKGPEE